MKEDKLYAKNEMKLYAERCMMDLVTKYPNGDDDVGEISSYDLYRIKQILNQTEDDELTWGKQME